MNTVPFDGQIFAVTGRSNADGRSYNDIHFYGKSPHADELVQHDARAVYYVERYGWDQAKDNAFAYDPAFDIFENLENGRRPVEEPDSILIAVQAEFERLQATQALSDRERVLACRNLMNQLDQSTARHAARVLRGTVSAYLSVHYKAEDD